MIKPTNNYVFVVVEKHYEDKISNGALSLDLVSFDETVIDKDDNVIYNNLEKRRIYGTVIGVPDRLVFNPDDPVLIRQVDPGLPIPERYIGHDLIKKVGTISRCVCQGECKCEMLLKYGCFNYEPQYKKVPDIEMQVEIGDKIYFHFNSLESENRIKLKDGIPFYKISYHNILCVVRNGKIIPVSGHTLVSPIYDEDVVDIGQGLRGKITKSGIVTETDMKYVDVVDEDGVNRLIKTKNGTTHRYLEGIVAYAPSPLKGDEIDFNVGDKIIYKKHSDWRVFIEGQEFFCIPYWDIEAKIDGVHGG